MYNSHGIGCEMTWNAEQRVLGFGLKRVLMLASHCGIPVGRKQKTHSSNRPVSKCQPRSPVSLHHMTLIVVDHKTERIAQFEPDQAADADCGTCTVQIGMLPGLHEQAKHLPLLLQEPLVV